MKVASHHKYIFCNYNRFKSLQILSKKTCTKNGKKELLRFMSIEAENKNKSVLFS